MTKNHENFLSNAAKDVLRKGLDEVQKELGREIPYGKELKECLDKDDTLTAAPLWTKYFKELDKLSEAEKEKIEENVTAMQHALDCIEEYGADTDSID